MSCNVTTFEAGSHQLPCSLTKAFNEGSHRSLFLQREWLQYFIDTVMLQDHSNWLVLEQCSEESLIPELLLPLRLSHRTLTSLTNYYSSYFSIIGNLARTDLSTRIDEMVETLSTLTPTPVMIRLSPLDPDAEEYQLLSTALRKHGWSVEQFFCFGNWYLPVTGTSYSDYFLQLPSKLRNTIRRKNKTFARDGGRLELYMSEDEIDANIGAFKQVYGNSWKKPEPYRDFVTGLIRLYGERGSARLGIAWLKDTPIASQFWIVHNGTAYIYKLAYDERFSGYSVGTLLSDTMFRYAIEQDHVQEIDYLTGDDAYKREWMTHRRERWGIIAYNTKTFRGFAGAARNRAKELLSYILCRQRTYRPSNPESA